MYFSFEYEYFFLDIFWYYVTPPPPPPMPLYIVICVFTKDRHIYENKRLPFVDRCEVTTIVEI